MLDFSLRFEDGQQPMGAAAARADLVQQNCVPERLVGHRLFVYR